MSTAGQQECRSEGHRFLSLTTTLRGGRLIMWILMYEAGVGRAGSLMITNQGLSEDSQRKHGPHHRETEAVLAASNELISGTNGQSLSTGESFVSLLIELKGRY